MSSSTENRSSSSNADPFKKWMHDLEEVAKIGRWEIDLQSRTTKWTNGVYQIFELQEKKIPSFEQHLSFYLDPFKNVVENTFLDLLKNGKQLEYEAGIKSASGKIKWVRVIGRKNQQADSNIVYGTIQDITSQKEIELQKSILISHTEEMFILVSRNFEILTFNNQFFDSYLKFFGRAVQKGDSILDYAQPGRIEEVKTIYNKVFDGNFIENKLTLKAPDTQEERIFSFSFKPALGENDDHITGAFVSIKDITDQRKTQLQLEENERRFRALVEQGSDGIAILDEQGNLKYITPSIQKILGYSVAEVMKLNLFELLHPDDMAGVELKVLESLENPGESIPGYTSRMRHKNGSWRWLEAVVTNMLDDPAVQGIVDNFRDVTDRIEAERELSKAHKKLSTHLENSPLGVVEFDKSQRITKWSNKCEQIFGWTKQEIFDQQITAADIVYKEDNQQVQKTSSELLSGTRDGNVSQNRNLTKDGRIIHCIWYNSVIKNEDGSVDTVMSLVEDITPSVNAKKELQKSYEEKSLLLSEIHHRVKNNLAIISGLMHLQAFKESNTEFVNVLLDSAFRVRSIALVHEQLYSSQDFRSIRLDENIKSLVENISSTISATSSIQIDYDLEPVELNINQAVPCALFINEAVTNVFKHAFAEDQEAVLRIECKRSDNLIRLNIEDNGKGFTKSDADNSNTLGLKLLEKVTQQLDGDLSFKMNGGTSVQLNFVYKEIQAEVLP